MGRCEGEEEKRNRRGGKEGARNHARHVSVQFFLFFPPICNHSPLEFSHSSLYILFRIPSRSENGLCWAYVTILGSLGPFIHVVAL